MTGIQITRYTSGDPSVVSALGQHGVAYDFSESGPKVTTLNRIKGFLSEYLSIQQPTKKLVDGILAHTGAGIFLGKGLDLTGNVCHFFLIHMEKFKTSVIELMQEGILETDKKTIDSNS